jgi:hypothetical protein
MRAASVNAKIASLPPNLRSHVFQTYTDTGEYAHIIALNKATAAENGRS